MGDLYFIQAGTDGPIKVGRSANVPARLRILQSGHYVQLRLLGTIAGRGWEEPLWHEALREWCLSGEWFDPREELLSAIAFALDDGPWWEKLPTPEEEAGGWEEVSEQEARDEWLEHMSDAVYGAWERLAA